MLQNKSSELWIAVPRPKELQLGSARETTNQSLFRKMSPHSSPWKSGWTGVISFVGLSQSRYRLQIFVWQRLLQKLSHQNKKSFLDSSHGIAILTARSLDEILESKGTQRFVWLFLVNSSFNDCCWRDFASSRIFSRRFRSQKLLSLQM